RPLRADRGPGEDHAAHRSAVDGGEGAVGGREQTILICAGMFQGARGFPPARRLGLAGVYSRVPVIGKSPKAPALAVPVSELPVTVAWQSIVIGDGTVISIFQLRSSPLTLPSLTAVVPSAAS